MVRLFQRGTTEAREPVVHKRNNSVSPATASLPSRYRDRWPDPRLLNAIFILPEEQICFRNWTNVGETAGAAKKDMALSSQRKKKHTTTLIVSLILAAEFSHFIYLSKCVVDN